MYPNKRNGATATDNEMPAGTQWRFHIMIPPAAAHATIPTVAMEVSIPVHEIFSSHGVKGRPETTGDRTSTGRRPSRLSSCRRAVQTRKPDVHHARPTSAPEQRGYAPSQIACQHPPIDAKNDVAGSRIDLNSTHERVQDARSRRRSRDDEVDDGGMRTWQTECDVDVVGLPMNFGEDVRGKSFTCQRVSRVATMNHRGESLGIPHTTAFPRHIREPDRTASWDRVHRDRVYHGLSVVSRKKNTKVAEAAMKSGEIRSRHCPVP